MPSISLTEQDLIELQAIINELRHKDAVPLLNFFAERQRRTQAAELEAKAATPASVPVPDVPTAQPNGAEPAH